MITRLRMGVILVLMGTLILLITAYMLWRASALPGL